jgi:hypothetical protein
MSVLSPKRVVQFVVASLLAVPLLANHPSPRVQARMAFDEAKGTGVLFGGRGSEDPATALTHASDETWIFVRDQWLQQFPPTRPSARSSHSMTYDSKRQRVLVFGGRAESRELRGKFTLLNDLWAWQNGNWSQVEAGNAPPARHLADIAYDRVRDRVILFGGYQYTADGKQLEALYDTWEFDGTSWTEVQATANGPKADRPILTYDAARNQTLLIGNDNAFKTQMHRYDPAAKAWVQLTPDPLPPCVNESSLVFQTHNQTVMLTGGLCSTDTSASDEVWQWDGTKWEKIDAKLAGFGVNRNNGAAYTYDTTNRRFVRFGGSTGLGAILDSSTYVLRDLVWLQLQTPSRPNPRSLAAFRRDPVRGTAWLFGGLNEFSSGANIAYDPDLWRYTGNEGWVRVQRTADPGQCITPSSAFDTDRQVLVVICGGNEVWEWNGDSWKKTEPKPVPDFRRFAGAVYDQNIKKVVMFGGYDNNNYRDETWTWDGTAWTRLKPNKKPGHRAQMAMWYDSRAKKTILYSGVGRPSIDEHVTRFSDMWSFDGTNWTEMTKAAAPGIRFGSQIAVDPRDGKVLLFGGLRATIDDKDNVDQFYANDTWLWDGTAGSWTQLQPGTSPSARQNGVLEFDDASGRFVLHGGFAGQLYLSDTWSFDGTIWVPVPDKFVDFRRRSARP